MAEKKSAVEKAPKKFYKSRKNRMIDGVCGGLAEYLNVDVNLVRVLWLLSVFLNGLGIIAYIVAMIVVPVNPQHKELKGEEKRKGNPAFYWGIFLVFMGFLLLSDRWDFRYHWHSPWHFRFLPWWRMPWETIWPLALVLLGVVYIIYIMRRDKQKDTGKEETKPESEHKKKLVRTPNDKMIGGVCGGIGRYFGIDSTIARLGFIVIALATNVFLGIVVYAVLFIALPQQEVQETATAK